MSSQAAGQRAASDMDTGQRLQSPWGTQERLLAVSEHGETCFLQC